MAEEPLFLDDETLTDNLDDEKANRVRKWLISVFQNDTQNFKYALNIVKEINKFIGAVDPHYRKTSSYYVALETKILDQIMTTLEEKYGKVKKDEV